MNYKMTLMLIPLFFLFFIISNKFVYAEEFKRGKGRNKIDNKSKSQLNFIHKECNKKKVVALTFDDGVVPATSDILDILKKHSIKATFFVLGHTLENNPMYQKVLKRILNDHHTIGSHSLSHTDLTWLSAKAIEEELKRTGDVIEKMCGERPRLLRPPYGKINDEVFKVTNSLGYTIVNWNVDTKDWQTAYDSNLIINSLSQRETDNSSKIVLMHDRPFTATVLEAVIKIYLKRGYTFVNMEKCLGIDGYF